MSEQEMTRRRMLKGAALITAAATGAALPSVVNGSAEGITSNKNHPFWKRAMEDKEKTGEKSSLYDNLGVVQKIEVLLRADYGHTTAYHSRIRELIPELMAKVSPAVTGTVVNTLERLKTSEVITEKEFAELVGLPT